MVLIKTSDTSDSLEVGLCQRKALSGFLFGSSEQSTHGAGQSGRLRGKLAADVLFLYRKVVPERCGMPAGAGLQNSATGTDVMDP